MTISILVNGAFGRMGQITTKAIVQHPNLELVGQTGREYNLKKAIQDSHAQVVVDFTQPDCVFANASTIIDAGAHPVIGTTGLKTQEIQQLQSRCADLKLGGIIAPNFSLGAVLMMKVAKEIVKYMPDVEIIEMHHEQKIDSPSGTAILTAQKLIAAGKINKASQEQMPHARGDHFQGIPIHSIRLPGLLAHQQIIFGNVGETLTMRHDTIDRLCFMPGVCLACEKVLELNHLVYGLEEIL